MLTRRAAAMARSRSAALGVAGQHLAAAPAGQGHDLALLHAGRQRLVGVGVAEQVRMQAIDTGSAQDLGDARGGDGSLLAQS